LKGLVLLASGLGLVISAAIWRVTARRTAVATVRWGLLNQDPAVRRAALVIAGQQGLFRYADPLLELARREIDPAISIALAEVVARNEWEPADDPKLIELRLWAQSRLAEAPSVPDALQPEPRLERLLPAPPGAGRHSPSSPRS
jgi:hypothetical protein